MDSLQAERLIERHASRNFLVNVLDGGLFFFGLSMVSRYTVLPLFVERLSGERWTQGLIPMLTYTGWLLPGLFIAPLVAARPRRKPFLLAATTGERLPFLLLGLLLLLAPATPPAMLFGMFIALYTVHAFSAGVASIPWQDFISRIIPGSRWGIFFGLQSGLGGLLGVGGASIATAVLATQPFPQSIGYLALGCFAAMVCSFAFLASSIEPTLPAKQRQTFSDFFRSVVPLLRRDTRLRNYLLSRAAIALGMQGHSFVTAAALERFKLPDAEVGIFTAALLGSTAASNLALGWLADRWGHKQVLVLSALLGMAALLGAVVAPSPVWFLPIFILVGAAQAGVTLTGFTLVFAFSEPSERATYIGVASTALAPIALIGPLAAGAFAQAAGYSALFVVMAAVGLIGMVGLQLRVPAPARTPPEPV